MIGGGQPVQLTEDIYIELVCSLFATLFATIILTVAVMLVGSWIVSQRHDPLLFTLFMLTSLAALWRIAILVIHRHEVETRRFHAVRAGQLERYFAWPYFGFALFLGLFAAWAFVLGANEHRLLVVGLVFGFGAGVAAGPSLRPWIGIPCALMAIVPMIVASFFVPNRWSTGVLTAAFLIGGIESMLQRYQATSRQFAMQRLLSKIDRRDELTGLANRIRLHEWFGEISASTQGAEMVAIHYLVLDRLKAINESDGYPAGDIVLKAASERLGRLSEDRTFAARLGGVEFAIVQPVLIQRRRAELFAEEIAAAIARPYLVSGRELSIGAHVGYVIEVQRGADLDRLLKHAGDAADRARREAGNTAGQKISGWAAHRPGS